MIENKVLVWLLAFAFIVTAAGFVLHTNEIDTLTRELQEANASLESVNNLTKIKKQTLAQKETENAEAKRTILAIEEIDGKIAKALEERDAANKKLEELEAQPEKLTGELNDTIQSVRKHAIGEELGDVKTLNGVLLQKAKIQKITDADITLAHATGIAKLTAKLAPREMVTRFRIKTEAELTAIAKARAAEAAAASVAAGQAPVAVAPPPVETSSSPPSSTTPEPDDAAKQAALAKVREFDNRIGDMSVQIRLAMQNKNSWLQQAEDYRSLHARAQIMGRSSSHLIKANDATSRANAIQSQIDAAQIAIEKLRQLREEARTKAASF